MPTALLTNDVWRTIRLIARVEFRVYEGDPMGHRKTRITLVGMLLGISIVAASADSGIALSTPVSDPWRETGPMAVPRLSHKATLLADGSVLVTGGLTSANAETPTAEIYSVRFNSWRQVAPMHFPRVQHEAVLLLSGRVLVIGGASSEEGNLQPEIYTPWTNRWTLAAPSLQPEFGSSATLLRNGRVLVVGGGLSCQTPEIYTPWTNSWSFAPQPEEAVFPCEEHVAVRLPRGPVLIHGGLNNQGVGFTGSFEFRPLTGTWYAVPDSPVRQSEGMSMVLLTTGKVLLVGGGCRLCIDGSRDTWLFDPRTSSWSQKGSLAYFRQFVQLAPLPAGKALAAGYGGFDEEGTTFNLLSAEVYDSMTGTWTQVPDMHVDVSFGSATALRNGRVLLVGLASVAELYVG